MCQISLRFLLLLSIVYATDAQIYDFCETPNNQQGECKVISLCPSLFSILQKRPIRSKDADFLRRSQCGFEGTLPKVCCSLQPAAAEAAPILTTTRPTSGISGASLLPSKDICGIDNQDKIYGGEQARLEDFPWMALIEYERDNGRHGFYCGGVLISKKYVLTAAHCLKGKDLPRNWKLVGVRLGEHNTDTEIDCEGSGRKRVCAPTPVNILVEERISHEQYDPFDTNQYHDIALLRLAQEVKFTPFVKPICLPKSSFDRSQSFTGKNLVVAGWGKTENRSESNIKLKLKVPVKSNEDCTRTYRQANVNLQDNQLCAGGEKGRDSCRGDSGGPLMSFYPDEEGEINWYSIGVVSFGPSPCGVENWPGVYTKVSNYVEWIISKLRP